MAAEGLTSIRDFHKQLTRALIVEAAEALIRDSGEASVTISDVAALAGVSERTVYRHFETRDALVQLVWKRLRDRIGASAPCSGDELIERPLLAFPRYDDERELVRAYLERPAKRGSQRSSSKTRRKKMVECVRHELPNLDEDKLRRRAAVAELLTSASAWDLMCRVWGFDGIEAGDAATEALQVLLGRCAAQ